MVSLFSICSLVIEKVNANLWFLIISKISNDNYFITMFENQRGHTFSMEIRRGGGVLKCLRFYTQGGNIYVDFLKLFYCKLFFSSKMPYLQGGKYGLTITYKP